MKRFIIFISNNGKWDSNLTLFYKTILWRIIGIISTSLLLWIMTGSLLLATSVGLVDTIIKLVLYWGFEKGWEKLKKEIC
jgi:uncharacterized membrane protein